MERFLARHSTRIVGTVSGFDRLLFRGTLRSISFVDGMDRLLASQRILYKDFAACAGRVTARVRAHAQQLAEQTGAAARVSPLLVDLEGRAGASDSGARCDHGGVGLYLFLCGVVHDPDGARRSRRQAPPADT